MTIKSLISVFLLIGSACSTSKVKITSNPPQAKIFQTGKGQKRLLGSTPLLLVNFEGEDIGYGQELLQLQIEKDGYIPEVFFLHMGRGSEVKINSTLRPVIEWRDSENLDGARILDSFSREIQAANNLIQTKKFKDAHAKLDKLISKYSSVSILYDLQGSLYVIEGKKDDALKSYEKSLSLNPLNVTTREFLQELRNK